MLDSTIKEQNQRSYRGAADSSKYFICDLRFVSIIDKLVLSL